MVISNIFVLSFALTYSNQLSTIWRARRSDVRPEAGELPFRLKELRTFACFPLSQHRGFYFPPPAKGWRSALSLQNGKRVAFFPLISFRMLTFNKVEEVQHIIVVPSTSHSGINYPPPALGWRSTLSLQKGAAYCMLSFCGL